MSPALFVYGSLVDPGSAAETLGREVVATPATLTGHRRRWCVWRHNRSCEKTFADAATGEIPEVVLGLGLEPRPQRPAGPAAPNGALIEVDEAELERLDRRELRYGRFDVTGLVEPGVEVGEPAARRRPVVAYRPAPEHHCATPPPGSVILAGYLRAVEGAFERLGGEAELERFRESTPLPDVPIIEARLVEDRIPEGNPREW